MSIEPKCNFCNVCDKNRCRTQEEAETCAFNDESMFKMEMNAEDLLKNIVAAFGSENKEMQRQLRIFAGGFEDIEPEWALFLDDERYPPAEDRNWRIARGWDEAFALIETHGFPTYASFDHDLGEDEPTGFDIVKEIVRRDQDKLVDIPMDFVFYVHSQNPVGAENIRSYLTQYMRVR